MITIYQNGTIYTGDQIIDSFAVKDEHFIEVPDISKLNTQDYEVIDLKHHFVLPGFNDSHMHLLELGNFLKQVDLSKHTSSLSDLLNALKLNCHNLEKNQWLEGRGWNQDYFTDENRFPNRYDLDKVSLTNPICITRACGHVCVVNSKALSLLDLADHSIKLADGSMDVDENGKPLGIFRENAISLLAKVKPSYTKEDIKEMILLASKKVNSYGITSCQTDDFLTLDNVFYEDVMAAYQELEAEGKLTVRVNEQSQFDSKESYESFLEKGYTTGVGTEYFKIGPLKMITDGSLGARTAFMLEPYTDDPTTNGIEIINHKDLLDMMQLAKQHHMQIAVHAIGDGAFDSVLSAYEELLQNDTSDHRNGIVHCQITNHNQIKRFAKLNLHAYIQSIFLDYDIHIVEDRVGDRALESYQFKHYMDLGCHVSNGSDCPVEMPNVLAGMQCAITRTTLKDHMGPYLLEEGCNIKEAVASFTSEGAYASFEEDIKGKIKEGMLADFVILDQNLFEINPMNISQVNVLATYLAGNKVFENE
ncbi:MAG: amidohydrolase [Erysipelotrichaceae bacterium]|nr:amidohydrolase [Erysipelotrichaceae bacterium]